MEPKDLIISICVALVITRFIFLGIDKIFKSGGNPMMSMGGPKPAIADVLAEINMLVQLECVAQIDIPQSVKTVPLITDFNEIQSSIVHNVLESLSMSFWMTANRAGLTRNYIITYTTRNTHAEILKFMTDHNYSMSNEEPPENGIK